MRPSFGPCPTVPCCGGRDPPPRTSAGQLDSIHDTLAGCGPARVSTMVNLCTCACVATYAPKEFRGTDVRRTPLAHRSARLAAGNSSPGRTRPAATRRKDDSFAPRWRIIRGCSPIAPLGLTPVCCRLSWLLQVRSSVHGPRRAYAPVEARRIHVVTILSFYI